MKAFVYLLSGLMLCACTKKNNPPPAKEKEKAQDLALTAKAEPADPGLKQAETLFDTYKRSHIEKSLETLKTIYPADLSIKAMWKGSAVPSSQWMANRKKFMNPIKSVEFGESTVFKSSKNTYVVVYKETVENFDSRKTLYFGRLELPQPTQTYFSTEEISVKEADHARWLKERS